MIYINYKKGYTLGITMIITSVTLLITMSIYALIYSEFQISDAGDQSIRAFYNADIGVECVKYYESLNTVRGTNPNAAPNDEYGATGFFLPAGRDKTPDRGPITPNYSQYSYNSDLKCGGYTVSKDILNGDNLGSGNMIYTSVPGMPGTYFLTKLKIRNTVDDICTDIKVYKTTDNQNALAVVATGYSTCSMAKGLRIAREVVYSRGFVGP